MRLEYLDFDLSIDARGGGEYEISARSETSGEATPRPRVRIDPASFAGELAEVHAVVRGSGGAGERAAVLERQGPSRQAVVQALGARLFSAVMVDAVVERYRVSLDKARDRRRGVRIRLRIQAPELAALPWEFMWDGRQQAFVVSGETTVVRHIEVDRAPGALSIAFPLRILGVVSGPSDQAALDKGAEQERIKRALAELEAAGRVQVTWVESGTFGELQAALRRQAWHVVHFIGHGGVDPRNGKGVLLLEHEDGRSNPVGADLLGQVLQGNPTLRLAVLNSCEGARANAGDVFSSTAGTLVRSGIPAVVAMQYAITDRAAVEFAQAFYAALADGQPVDAAVSEARLQLSASNSESAEWGTPVLFMRPSSGALFDTGTHEVPDELHGNGPPDGPDRGGPPSPDRDDDLAAGRRARASRRRTFMGVGAAVGAAMVLLLLSFWHVSSGVLNATIRAERIALRLGEAATLADAFTARRVGAAGMQSVVIPPVDGVPGAQSTSVASLRVSDSTANGRGSVTLDLRALPMPAGAMLVAQQVSADGRFLLSFSSAKLPRFGITIDDWVLLNLGPENRAVHVSAPQRIQLVPGTTTDTVVDLTLSLARLPQSIYAGLHVVGLSAMALEESDKPGAPYVERSTLKSAELSWGTASRAVSVGAGAQVRLGQVDGTIEFVELDTAGVRATFRGRVAGATRTIDGVETNLMPTLLQLLSSPVILMLVAAGLLVGGLVSELLFRLTSRRSRQG